MKNKKLLFALSLLVVIIFAGGIFAFKIKKEAKKTPANISLAGPRGNVPEGAPSDDKFGVFSIPVPGVLSRSGQPSIEQFRWLKENGWKSVVELRQADEKEPPHLDTDMEGFKEIGLTYLNIPIKDGGTPDQQQDEEFLKFVTNPENQPVHIHCNAGTGRTGLMTALYRYAVQSWPVDQVLAEKELFGSRNKVQKKWLEKWASKYSPGSYAK